MMNRAEALDVYESLRYACLNVKYKQAIDLAFDALREQEEIATNLQHRASNEQVTEPLRPNGFSDSKASIATKNQVTSEWIVVKDRKPEKELSEIRAAEGDDAVYPCLVARTYPMLKSGRRYVAKAWFGADGFVDSDLTNINDDVTHWMPLPEPPKEG